MKGAIVTLTIRLQLSNDRLSIITFRRILCRFRTNLDDGLCLFVERIQLLTHKLGLNFDDLFQILSLAKFLYKVNSSGNVVRGIAQKFFV